MFSSTSQDGSNPFISLSQPDWPEELWAYDNLAGCAWILVLHFVGDTLILVLLELDLNCCKNFTFRTVPAKNLELELDEDVLREE